MDFHRTYYSIKSKLERLKNNINNTCMLRAFLFTDVINE